MDIPVYNDLHALYKSGRYKNIIYNITLQDCWVVTSHIKDKDGYVRLRRNNKDTLAHRYVYEKEKGLIPEGFVVMHKCDNPSCININHLDVGTQQDNQKDKVYKNRQAKGEINGAAKLTEQDVKAIREDKRRYKDIVARYPVDQSLIAAIRRGSIWKHIL